MSKGQKCCVPSCDPGPGSGRFFRPPVQKPQLVQSWKDVLATSSNFENFDPAVNWVCSKHFKDHFILKEDVVFENGERISIPLTNWRLKDDAIPTIFEKPKPKQDTKNVNVKSTSPILDPGEESTEKLQSNEEAKTNDDGENPSAENRGTITDKIFEEKEDEELSKIEVEPDPVVQKVANKVSAKKKSKKSSKKKKINPRLPQPPVVVGPGRKQVLISRVDLGDRIDNVTIAKTVAQPPLTTTPITVNISRLTLARGRGRPLGKKKAPKKEPPKKNVLGRGRGRPSGAAKIKPLEVEVSSGDTDKIWKPGSGLLGADASSSSSGLSKGRAKRTIRSASWRPSGDNYELLSEEEDVMETDPLAIDESPTAMVPKLKVVVPKCFMDTCKDSPSANLYKCPLSDRKIITKWMTTVPQSNRSVFDVSQDLLCDKHFESKYFVNLGTGTILSKDAIPTRFEEKSLKRSLQAESPLSSPKMPKLQVEGDSTDDIDPVSRFLGLRCYSRRGGHTEVIEREPTEISLNKKNVDKGSKAKSKAKSSMEVPNVLENGLPLEENIIQIPVPIPPPKPQEVLLRMGQVGYDLNYIFKVRDKFVLPSNIRWIFEIMTDAFTKQESIYLAELVSRNDELTFQRVIKIFQDLTFKVETNGIDVTSMFNELGTQIDSLTKLQEIVDDLSAFQVCQGWPGFKMVVDCEVGKKVGGIWYSKNCESLKLDRIRCQPCSSIANALRIRKTKILKILQKAETSIQNQFLLLPPDDPLRLQTQIQELTEERNKLKKDLMSKNVKELRLQKNFKVLTNNLHQGQTMRVKVMPAPASKSNQLPGPSSQKQKIANRISNVSAGARTPTSTTTQVQTPAPAVRKKPGPLSRTAVGFNKPTSADKSNNISTVRTSSSITAAQKNATTDSSFRITDVLQSADVVQSNPTVSNTSNSETSNASKSATLDGFPTVSSLAPIHTFDHSDTLLINSVTGIIPSTSITYSVDSSTPSTSTGTYFLLPESVTTMTPEQMACAALGMNTPSRPLFVSHNVGEYDEEAANDPFSESDVITLL